MRPKIAVVDPASYTLPYDFYFVRELAKRCDVYLFCSTTPFNWEYAERLKEIDGVTVVSTPISSVSRLKGLFNYLKVMVRLAFHRGEYRAVHFQWQILRGPAACVELFFFWLVRKKLVFTVHNPVPHGYTSGRTYWIFRWIRKLARRLIFVSAFSQERFLNDYGPCDDTVVLQHGLMPLEPEDDYPVGHHQNLERKVVFWGNVKPYKGVDLIAEMAESALFRDFRFEVYGKWDNGMEALMGRLERASVHVQNRFLETREVRKLLLSPAVFIFPYQDATQSGVLYTMLHYVCCFITTDCGDNAHFARRHGMPGIVFERPDLNAARQSLDYVMSHVSFLQQRLSDVRSQYRWEEVIQDGQLVYPGADVSE